MSTPANNPVAYTYTSPDDPPNTGSTKNSVPHPPAISKRTYTIAGIQTTVYGLAEIPPSSTNIAVLWLLHPRLQAQSCMAPFAAHSITIWKNRNQNKSLIAVSFDQRNHGTREVNPIANEAWRSGNETHAQDMFSCYQGTAQDTSELIDYLAAYVFPEDEKHIVQHIVMGISLGGHAAWHVLMHDARVSSAVVMIGCSDYERLMTDRARLSKRKTWLNDEGRNFVGSKDFPPGLVNAIKKYDPAGFLSSSFERPYNHSLTEEEKGRLIPMLNRTLRNKRILNLSGGSDKLVPYAMGKPFLDWLKMISGKGGFFEDGGFYLEDIIVPGTGHEVPPEMVKAMDRFMIDTLEHESDGPKTRRDSRI